MNNNIPKPANRLKTLISEDPIEAFLEDILPRMTIDVIPWDLLWSMYKSWETKLFPNVPIKDPVHKKNFIKKFGHYSEHRNYFIHKVRRLMGSSPDKYPGWHYTYDKNGKGEGKRINPKMDTFSAEPLLGEYGCTEWIADPINSHIYLKSSKLHETMRGLYRI